MEVKIWSDVRCPFCYIGKRRLESALEKFPEKEKVTITWKSFQLDPSLKTDEGISTIEYFVNNKGVSVDQAQQMLQRMMQMGQDAGLKMDLENSVMANSFKAHRLLQMAKSKGLGNELKEELLKVHFEESKNIDEDKVLLEAGESIGLPGEEVEKVLQSDDFAYEVKQDELEARNLGVRGVPFFVFDDKYAISGAQSEEVFLQTLEKAWEEFNKKNIRLEVTEGDSCSTDGNCD